MKILITILIFLIIFGCKNKKGLELEVINNEIVSLKVKPDETIKYFTDNVFNIKSKNIIVYKLTNNDNRIYFFNLNIHSDFLKKMKGINIEKGYLNFFDSDSNNVFTHGFSPSIGEPCENEFIDEQNHTAKELGYKIDGMEKFYYDNKNFIIHPNETLFFESYVNLPLGGKNQYYNARFDNKKEYNAEIIMISDTTNYKKTLSRTVLQTIKENGYVVYHGVIKSKNKIPVKFIE